MSGHQQVSAPFEKYSRGWIWLFFSSFLSACQPDAPEWAQTTRDVGDLRPSNNTVLNGHAPGGSVVGKTTQTNYPLNLGVVRPSEDIPLSLSTEHELFSGLYCDSGDLIVGYAGDLSDPDLPRLVEAVTSFNLPFYCHNSLTPTHEPQVVVVQQQYNFLSLRSWRDALTEDVFENPNVHSLGIDYQLNRLVISAGENGPDPTPNVVQHLIPSDAFVVIRAPSARLTTACNSPGLNDGEVEHCFEPLTAGIQEHSSLNGGSGQDTGPGTVTAVAPRYNPGLGSYQSGFVTCGHCVPPIMSMTSGWTYQPGYPSGNDPAQQVGVEFVDPPGWSCGSLTCRNSDSVWEVNTRATEQGTIVRTLFPNTSTSPPSVLSACDHGAGQCYMSFSTPRFYSKGSAAPIQGMQTEKVGRTTGWSTGIVTSTCSDITDDLGHKYVCNGMATNWVEAGDSGSPLFYWWWSYGSNISTVEQIGLIWGSGTQNTLFSPWSSVAADLGTINVVFAPSFTLVSGQGATDVGVGANGTVWIITNTASSGNYTIKRYNGSTWSTMPGLAVRIAVDPSGNAWVVNAAGQIYSWQSSTSSWTLMPGAARDIGIGADGSVWVVSPDSPNGTTYRWNGSNWTYVSGAGVRLAVDETGNPWVIASDGSIWRYSAGSFSNVAGGATDVGISADGMVWVLGTAVVTGGYNPFWWSGAGWVQVPGAGRAIAAGRGGHPWIADTSNQLFRSSIPTQTPVY